MSAAAMRCGSWRLMWCRIVDVCCLPAPAHQPFSFNSLDLSTPEDLVWFDFSFTALQHILGHFGCGQLTLPHCSWASLLGSLPVLSAHSFASN